MEKAFCKLCSARSGLVCLAQIKDLNSFYAVKKKKNYKILGYHLLSPDTSPFRSSLLAATCRNLWDITGLKSFFGLKWGMTHFLVVDDLDRTPHEAPSSKYISLQCAANWRSTRKVITLLTILGKLNICGSFGKVSQNHSTAQRKTNESNTTVHKEP